MSYLHEWGFIDIGFKIRCQVSESCITTEKYRIILSKRTYICLLLFHKEKLS